MANEVYEVSITKVETVDWLISKYTKKWLEVPNSLTNVALYSSSTKLKLPTSRLFPMLHDSRDSLVKNAQPSVITGRKKKAKIAVGNVESALKMKKNNWHWGKWKIRSRP